MTFLFVSPNYLIIRIFCGNILVRIKASRLYNTLKNKLNLSVELWTFPHNLSQIGKLIDEYLTCNIHFNYQVFHLLSLANRWERINEMHDKLAQGINIIIDRYIFTDIAYAMTKLEIDIDWCKKTYSG
jgi:dTMP kinase